MNLQEIRNAIKRHADILNLINDKISKLDPGLTENARNERIAEIQKPFSLELSELRQVMERGGKWCLERRTDLSDPALALAVAALEQGEKATIGDNIMAANLSMLTPLHLSKLSAGKWHPAVTAAIVAELKRRIESDGNADPVMRRKMFDAIEEAARRHVDQAAVAELAAVELAIIDATLTYGGYSFGKEKMVALDAVERLSLGREKVQLEQIVARALTDHNRRIVVKL